MQLAALLRRRGDRVHEPRRGTELAALVVHRGDQAGRGILRPRVVHDDRRATQLPQPASDAGAEQRALADPTRPVEHGQPVREHVRRHGCDLTLTAEEEKRIELRVLERGETLVRTLRYARQDATTFSSARSSSAT